ncbi:phospho-sugar mutase [Nostocoides sp. F2B08]|uniref:phospho-sugar mutase n=1 Tax=Nostocoides sp. F2B08 TaxID=2653936 RepID=UPI0012631ADC|nr:phospho-sugar mutase [Tetrasphaera sp. F2B08]KAB7741973.1 phospho-sugar mutase [Tetrasphaera sp. F2B08]
MTYSGTHQGEAPSEDASRSELIEVARAWLEDDPDERTREELTGIIARVEEGDDVARAELLDRFSGMLEFGTAGLRGRLGAGPNRMCRSVVIRAAAGLIAYLTESVDSPLVAVGHDARYNSDVFARDTCGVVLGMGGRAVWLPRPLPTPVLAFAVRRLGAQAGVMVTASHNPPEDNGYKVYLGDGSQIVSPVDVEIARRIARVETVADVPRSSEGWSVADESLVDDYIARAVSVLDPATPRDISVVHTALHGVGTETIQRAFAEAGFAELLPVASQAQPDPAFPTVSFPNPEEPGAMDAALELAEQTGPDLVIANDPDADRCAVAIPGPGGWRMLRGDEVGALIGAHIIARGVPDGAVFANSIVSSRLLGAMASAAGIAHEETLTGFKWISRVEGLRYGYEEALGYCVDPDGVRDKDGITAALLIAEQAAVLKSEGRALSDVLDDLARAHGVYHTDSFSVRVEDLSLIERIMARLREDPPTDIGGITVERIDDLARGDGGLPPTDGLRYLLSDRTRIIVRPSGTEPKVKIYCEVIEPVADDLAGARKHAVSRMSAVRETMEGLTSLEGPDASDRAAIEESTATAETTEERHDP